MDLQELLKRLQEAKSRDAFGYGITTADRYVQQVIKSVGTDRVAKYLGDTDLDTVLKEACSRVVYANPESTVDKLATSVEDMKAILPKGTEPPKHSLMVIKHTLTTPKEDRDGDVLATNGAVVDPAMPLLWQHMSSLPIGKRMATIMHNAKKLQLASVLLDLNELTSDVAKLVEADALRFSHGFRTLDWEDRYDKQGNWIGFHILKFEIMEASLVSVPSNTDAVIELYSRDKFTSDLVKSTAKELFDARQKQAPGIELEESDAEPEGSEEKAEPVVDESVGDVEKTEEVAEVVTTVEERKDPEETATTEPEDETKEITASSVDAEKAGREISAKNLAVLVDCVDDLKDFLASESYSDLKRAEKVMLQGCYDRLSEMVERLVDDENSVDEIEQKSESISTKDAAAMAFQLLDFVLVSDDPQWKRRTLEALKSRIAVEEDNQRGVLFSRLKHAAS